jgi:hypothetical protein
VQFLCTRAVTTPILASHHVSGHADSPITGIRSADQPMSAQ